MARPKRMGAYNALDDLLPGPAWGSSGDQGPARDLEPADADDQPAPPRRPRLEPVPDLGRRRRAAPRARSAGRHLGVWNPLDGPPPAQPAPGPAPAPAPAKARVSFRLPADLVETARDAVAHLAGTADQTTLTALAERALRVELARLAITHNNGRPFPPRYR